MKVTTGMLSNLLKAIRVIYRIQRDSLSYRELIEELYGEAPPADRNFLRRNYSTLIAKTVDYGRASAREPLFSVIIPTHNRRAILEKTLEAVVNQKGVAQDDFEIIIVDNGSCDGSEETIRRFASAIRGSRIVYIKLLKNYGGDLARNIGVERARGSFLVFTDDDCLVPHDWLYEFRREFENDPKLSGAGGFKIPKSPEGHSDIYQRFILWSHFFLRQKRTLSASPFENSCGAFNANVCYRREVFQKAGGFDIYFRHIASQEFRIRLHKAGARLLYEPRMVEHLACFTLKTHILKLIPQSLDIYLLHQLYPDIWQKPSFYNFLKRTIREICLAKRGAEPPLYGGSFSEFAAFSFLSVVTNFFLWLGKYWVVLNILLANKKMGDLNYWY
jgi:GT2 family glycosyltransferase